MSVVVKKIFSVFNILLFFSFAGYAADKPSESSDGLDTTAQVICNVIGYIWRIGGPLMTIVIIGASLLAIFGRMPWPALFALGAFTAVFFGAPKVVEAIIKNDVVESGKSNMTKCTEQAKKIS